MLPAIDAASVCGGFLLPEQFCRRAGLRRLAKRLVLRWVNEFVGTAVLFHGFGVWAGAAGRVNEAAGGGFLRRVSKQKEFGRFERIACRWIFRRRKRHRGLGNRHSFERPAESMRRRTAEERST